MWSRLHVRWGNTPRVTSPTWGPPPLCKQVLSQGRLQNSPNILIRRFFSLATSRLCKTDYKKITIALHSKPFLREVIISDLHPNINLHCHVSFFCCWFLFFHFRVLKSSWPNLCQVTGNETDGENAFKQIVKISKGTVRNNVNHLITQLNKFI